MIKHDGPIFLTDASRSGTALVSSVLNNDPVVYLAGETHYCDDLRAQLGDRAERELVGEDKRRCEDYFLALAQRLCLDWSFCRVTAGRAESDQAALDAQTRDPE